MTTTPSSPKTFEAHGHMWITHQPGDPTPIEGSTKVHVLLSDGTAVKTITKAGTWMWDKCDAGQIVGWRYAEEKKTGTTSKP